MKKNQSKGDSPLHQTVAEEIEFKVEGKAMAVRYTEQQLSGHAGTATFWSWVHGKRWRGVLKDALPHGIPQSNNALAPVEKALGFVHGLVVQARKLTQVAYLRIDPVVPELVGIRRVASQATLSRFFAGFESAGANLRCFRTLWRWALEQLPSLKSGYALDLDSTRLLHEDGHQEGVKVGYTRQGLAPCLHPLLAVLAEARVVVQLWLRPGNTACANNVESFCCELYSNLPRHLRIRLVRADSGFYAAEVLDLWEKLKLPYIVVAKLTLKVQSLIRHEMVWQQTEDPDTAVAECYHQAVGWQRARRLILLRRRVKERQSTGGKKLLEVPGYVFQAFVTSLPESVTPLAVWREYNGRADCENVIKELQSGFALTSLCLEKFWATEAALSLATVTYNLMVLFQRHLGWQSKATMQSLRFWLFNTPGIISHPARKTVIKLAIPPRHRKWWSALWEKILCPLPNCNAVEDRPQFAT